MIKLTKLSPISHFVTKEELFVLDTFSDDLGATRNDSPNNELDFKLCKNLMSYLKRQKRIQNFKVMNSKSLERVLNKLFIHIIISRLRSKSKLLGYAKSIDHNKL